MPDLVPTSPLFMPVVFGGQLYLTSQYFHRQYLENSPPQGKHRRYDSFMRLLRNIEAFHLYIEQGSILEVVWDKDKPHFCGELKPLFQAAGFHPLILLNKTAQAAMSHHLDDTLSQQMSVAVNTLAARESFAPEDADLLVISKALQAIAATRQEVRQLATQTAKNTTAIARLESREERLTIEEYVIGHRLQRKMPERLWGAYGKHLRAYCETNGIAAPSVPVEGKPWKAEKEYPVSTLHETFAAWLFAINGQADL